MPRLSPSNSMLALVGIEVIAVGVGAALTPTAGWIVAAFGVPFLYPAAKEWWHRRRDRTESMPEIKVIAEENIRFEGPNGDIQSWYLAIQASSDADAQDVEVKVEYWDKINDILEPKNRSPLIMKSGVILKFEKGSTGRLTIRRGDSERVRLVSFCKNAPKRWIQIGEYSEHTFSNHDKIVSELYDPHRLDLTIRAANSQPIPVSFLVKIEHEMLMVRNLL